jgi:hypothetical protein
MEVYIGPPENVGIVLRRDQVLAALAQGGLSVTRTDERPASGRLQAIWTVSFDGTDAALQFQETEQGLIFATLEQSMFDNSDVPDRVCGVLEALGWEVDQENVG